MSKYVTLHSTITKSSLALAKSTIPTTPVPAPTVYSTPYTSLTKTPHISVLIYTLKKGAASSMLPHLVGHAIVPRGSYTGKFIASTVVPAGMTIISTTSTGYITYSYYGASGGYGSPVKISICTSSMKLTKLIKMLKSGLYTMV